MPIYELQAIRIGKPYAYDETTKARRREEKNQFDSIIFILISIQMNCWFGQWNTPFQRQGEVYWLACLVTS